MKWQLKNKGKLTAMALVATMTMGSVPAFAATSDVQGHWAEESISTWREKGLVSGYSDGTFKPDAPVSRAEFVRFMNQAFGLTKKGEVKFTDVSSANWFYNDVTIAMGEGYTKGFPDGSFRPNETVTRAQAAVFISNALGLSQGASVDFADAKAIPAWAQGAVAALVKEGYMSGYQDNSFRAQQTLTRAEAVSTLNRAMNPATASEEDKAQPETEAKNLVVEKSGTKLSGIKIEGDVIISEKVGNGAVYLENVKINGSLIVQGGGERSVYLADSTIEKKVVLDKKGVRLQISGNTQVSEVEIKQACNLQEKDFNAELGKIKIVNEITEPITIGASARELILEESANVEIQQRIKSLVVEKNAVGSKLEVAEGGKVETLTANAKAAISGDGTIDSLEAKADGITVSKSVMVSETKTETGVKPPSTPATGGGGGGGGGGGTSGGDTKAEVTAVSIVGLAKVNETLTATVTPTNATVTYQWTSSDAENGTHTNISAATKGTYTLTANDVDKYIKVVVTGTGNYTGTKTSAQTAKVAAATAAPIITPIEDEFMPYDEKRFTPHFTCDKDGTYYSVVQEKNVAAPTKEQIVATSTSSGEGSDSVTKNMKTPVPFTGLTKATAYVAYIVVQDAGGNISEIYSIAFVTMGGQQPPTDLTPVAPSAAGASDGKITGVTTEMEYSKDGKNTYSPCTGTEITGLSAGTYYVRYAEKTDGEIKQATSEDTSVTVADGPATP